MTDDPSASHPQESSRLPTREELQAELLDVTEPTREPEPKPNKDTPGALDAVLNTAVRYVRGQRGGDLVAVILVGSAVRRAFTSHSDVDLIAVLKGEEEKEEMVRIGDRLVEIRYRGYKNIERELPSAPRLPPLLRKGRVLFEHEAAGTRLVEKGAQRFRQGPPPLTLNEKIRLKANCLHWLGKAEDLRSHPEAAQYLLTLFLEDAVHAFFRLRGLWLTSPSDTVRFVASRDAAVGEALARFLLAPSLGERVDHGRALAELLFREIPQPPRVD